MTDLRCWNDLATENAALWEAFDFAVATIGTLADRIGNENPEAERRAMVKVDEWSKLRRRLQYLRGGDHRRGMVIKALEEAA